MDDAFGHWLAGFIDGEGSFQIVAFRGRFDCRFRVKLRDDDRAILEEIVKRTGIGRIKTDAGHGSSKPQAVWKVQNKAECLALVQLLDRYPVRAKKARDYVVWRAAVMLWLEIGQTYKLVPGHGNQYAAADWSGIEPLHAELARLHTYQP